MGELILDSLSLIRKITLGQGGKKNLIYGQAACLLGYFQEQLTKNPSFQYGVQLDNIE